MNDERAQGERRFVTIYSGDKCKFEVEGLEPGATYCFQVQAVNKLGAGPYSGNYFKNLPEISSL
jgi:hypothetical protein